MRVLFAADGIAMAAVSTTQKSDLQLLVFVAIMLHKVGYIFQ